MSVLEVYGNLIDVEKLALCYHHKESGDILKVYSELLGYGKETAFALMVQEDANLDNGYTNTEFLSLFNEVLFHVRLQLLEVYGSDMDNSLLNDASDEIIRLCVDWFDSLNIEGD